MAHHPHEEAEHASHHAQDPFDKRVAMSMVVIAAILAMVKVLGHRTHNDTLAYRIESGVQHTQASDQWNFFQAKKMREVLARQDAKLLLHLTAPSKGESTPAAGLPDRGRRLEKVTADLKEGEVEGAEKKAAEILDKAAKRYESLTKSGIPAAQADRIVASEIEADRYNAESKAIQAKAKAFAGKADKALGDSEHKHHQAFFFDLGELGVELALVLSSIAILTKAASYWYGGLVVCLAGLASIAMGFFAH